MKRILLFLLVFSMFAFVGCNDDNPIQNDTGDTGNTVDTGDTGDTGNTGDSSDTSDTSDSGDSGNSGDSGDSSDTGDTNVGKHCEKDPDCGTGLICVNQKCSMGCKEDAECKAYGSLRCNKKLGRCLNLAASAQACSETKCPKGCCYSNEGFTELKCAAEFTVAVCGMCPQGQVFRKNECVSAVCSATSDKCPTYNSAEEKPECFECKAGALICYENPTCGTGGSGSGVVVNVLSCIPAGQACLADSDCCSSQPCIQGYCY